MYWTGNIAFVVNFSSISFCNSLHILFITIRYYLSYNIIPYLLILARNLTSYKMSWKMSCLASCIVCLWLEGFVKTLENSLLTSELLYIEGRNLQNLFLESSPQLQYVIYWAPTSDFWNVREFIDPNSSPYVHKRIFALRDRHLINMHMKEFRQCFFLYQPRFQNIRTSQIPFCTHLTKDLSGDILLKATYNYSGICFLDKQRRKEKQINWRQCFWVPN